MSAEKAKGSVCAVAQALVTDLVQIGSHAAQKQQMGRDFPLVLCPAKEGVSFVDLQEYFIKHHEAIIKAASEVRPRHASVNAHMDTHRTEPFACVPLTACPLS